MLEELALAWFIASISTLHNPLETPLPTFHPFSLRGTAPSCWRGWLTRVSRTCSPGRNSISRGASRFPLRLDSPFLAHLRRSPASRVQAAGFPAILAPTRVLFCRHSMMLLLVGHIRTRLELLCHGWRRDGAWSILQESILALARPDGLWSLF